MTSYVEGDELQVQYLESSVPDSECDSTACTEHSQKSLKTLGK